MKRLDDWPERLMATIAVHQAAPFTWGQHDCATFFADCVAAVSGVDPFAEFRPWTSEHSALRALAKSGSASVAEFVAQNFDEIVPADARRGDIGWVGEPTALACPAILVGAVAMSRDDRGFIVFSRALITRAFKIGD